MSAMGQKRPKLPWLPAAKSATEQRVKFVPIAVVSGLLNSKKLLRCTFGDNLERRPKCWIGVLRVGGIVMYASVAHPFLLMV